MPYQAAASTVGAAAASYCKSYVGSTSDANYKPCITWYTQAANAKENGTINVVEEECHTSPDTAFCTDAIVAGEAKYTKAPSPGAGASHPSGSSPVSAGCPSGGCISTTNTGIPTVGVGSGLQSIVDVLGLVAGILSVIFLIAGGIRYSTSEGNPQNVSQARLTITYAVIGVILSILAPLIVGFVVSRGPQ